MGWRPHALTPEQKEYYKQSYASHYNDNDVDQMLSTVNEQQKSILERLQTLGYKDAKARTQLRRDLYEFKYTLSALGALGVDVSAGRALSNEFDNALSEQSAIYSQFENEDSYLNALWSSKYKGKSVSNIDDIINRRNYNGSVLDDKEYNWLVANRDTFMSKDELLSEIGTLEGNSQQLKQDKWLNRFDYAGNLIGGAFAGDTSRMRAYDTAPETAEIENNARLKKLKELLAGKDDFDAESAYKKADEKNLWDVITTDYTYADYLNDKDSKNIYGNAVVRQRDEENFQIISDNSKEFDNDFVTVTNIILNKQTASAMTPDSSLLGGLFSNAYDDNLIMQTDPEIQKIIKKWSDKGYDFESLYNSYQKNANANYNEWLRTSTAEETQNNPVLSNIGSVFTNVAGGIAALPSIVETGIEDLLSDDIVTLDTNAPEWALKNATDSIRDTTSQMISEKNEGIKGGFFNFLYQTGISIADMGAATLVSGMNPTGMQIIMGTNAAADSIKTVTEKGGSIDEALLTGLTSGIFEALFEKVSIDNLFRTATSDTGKKLIYNFVKGFLSEGSEELCTEIANTFADALINGNNSEFNNSVYNYMADGKTAAEARSLAMVDTMKQMGLSFAGGALSGGLVSGVGGGINLMSANSQYSRVGNEIINNGNVDSVMQLGYKIVKNQHNEDVAYDLGAIEKYQKGIENKAFRTSGKADINTAVENRLGEFGVTDSKVANRVTDAFIKGTEYRKTGNATVDKYASRVLSELRSSENATGRENFTNEWASPVVDKARTDAKTAAADKYRARDIGRLAGNVQNAIINSTQENINTEIKKGIQARAEELGVDKSTSKTAADIVFKAFMGDKLTPGQHRILEKNQIVKRVYNELKAADEVGINDDNSWVAPVLENTGVMRAEQIAQLSRITTNKENTVTEDGVIDDVKTDLPDVETFDSDVKTAPSVVNGTEDFDSFVESVRSESMATGVVKKYSKTEIDNKTAGQIAVLDAYGRKHGLSFIVVDSIGEGDTRANGTYVGKNKVLISLDAEGGALLSVAGHEVYHYIARNNKLGADSIKAFVIDKLKNNANYDYEFEFNKLVKSYGTENVDEIEEEMVANAMFELLSDEDVINDLAKENPTLLEKIIAAIKDFIKELKEMAEKLPWAEVAVFQDDIQSLETIKVMAETALWNIKENGVISSENANKSTASDVSNNAVKVSNSGKNVSNTETKNTAEVDGVVKYNFKSKQIYAGMPDSERAEILKNSAIKIAQYSGNEELNGKNVLMLKSTYRKKAREILIELSEKFQIFDSKYLNENIELEFEYSRNSLKESVNKQGDISTDFYDFAKMLYIFDDVIKNAVPIEVHTDKYEGTKRANPNLKYDYVLLSAFSDGEYIIPVEFHIKEFKENVKEPNKLYVSITLGKIKIENKVIAQVAENYINNNQWQSARLFSEISIPQLIKKINPEYGNFYKYIPSEMLNNEQIKSKKIAVDDEEYKLKVMRDEDVSDILSRKASEKGYDADTSWRMDHKAPNAKYDVCITDIDKCYGGDGSIYSPKAAYYYGDGRSYDQKAINAIKKARKSPETLISIYRAVPDNIKDTRVRNGDWVSIDKEYAEEHGWRMFDDDYRIIENKVPAKYLFTDGNSIHEFGYDNGNSNEVYKNTENNVKLNEVTYDDKGNLIPLSKRFDEDKPDIRFSLQETAQAGEAKEKLIQENDNLRVANTLLKKEMKLTRGRMLSLDNTRLIARQLTEQYSSDYDRELLARQIYNIFNHYDETGDYDYLMNYLATIGKRVVARSSAVDNSLYEDYEDCRKWVRNMEFTLPEQVLKQLNENYDGQFVKKTFGRMRYVSRATHPNAPFLSQIYSELANEYPNFFSIEDNEYEQPMRLIEFWEKIQPTVYNPVNEMGYATEDDAAVGFAFDVFNAYSKTDKLETFADKKKKEIENIRKEYDRNLERAKQKLNADRDRRLEWQKEYYINAREKSSEGRKKAYVKKKIRNVIKDLDKYLNRGSKDKNVKDDLQETVQTALTTAELLFSDIPSNEDIIRAGVTSFTKKEAQWLDEYDILLKKRDDYSRAYALLQEKELTEDVMRQRENLNSLIDNANKRLRYLDKCLEDVFEREKRRLENATVGEALSKLAVTYAKIKDSEHSYISQSYDENVYDKINELVSGNNGSAKISLLTLNELDSIYEVYKMVLHTVRNANKIFTGEKKQTAEELGKIAMRQIREVGGNKKRRIQALDFLKRFGWSELKPVYAFRLIGSDVLQERYAAMRNGEDTYYRDVSHAKEFYAKLRDKYKTDEWKLDKGYEFVSKDGEKFTLTLEQIMSIYAYCRRGDQAVTHLTRGGFVFSDAITVEEKKKGQIIKYKVDDGAAYSLSPEVLGEINHVLDDNKRAFVEEMQTYLSDVMGDKGNEVSMKMYGVKLFKEKNYFPLKSSAFYKAFDGKVEGESSLKNAGFSKATTPKANNPIVLDDFLSVWSNHVQDMAMYHSFVLPIEDFTKVFNYESHGAEDSSFVSVKATLQGAYGPSAEQYVRNLLTDINSGVRSQTGAEFINKLTGVAKKNAVFASMSVVIQQPSAVVRAAAHVNPKYFINAFPQSAKWLKVSKEYEELKKYAPVAGIKEMGYFDTGLGKSTADWITEKEYRGFGKKFKAFVSKDGKYRDDVFSMLAGKADEVSWVYIWNAVKKEVSEKQQLSGEALLNAAGKRFTEVIELTQVYDSVFSRSGLMRSKDSAVKMVTSFMAEPTTQINMLFDAVFVQGKRGNKKYAAAVVGAVYASIFVNALLKAVVTAARDDDEEFSYSEKYISDVISSFLSDGILVSSIPFLRDVVSIFKGYDVERMDMSVISDIVNSIKALESDKKTTFEKAIGIVASLLLPLGIPATNIVKDAKALYNIYSNIINKKDMSWNALGERLNREILLNSTPKAGLLYNAIVSGDTEYAERLKAMYETESGYNTAIREGLKKYDSRIYDAAVARMEGNTAEYMRLAKEIIAEGNFSQDNIVTAIKSVINSLETDEEPETEDEEKKKSIFEDSDYFDAIIGGDGKTADIVGKDLVDTDVANGKTQEDAEKSLVSSLRDNIRDAFDAGEIEYSEAKNILVKYCGMSETEADNKLKYWDFRTEYPDYDLAEETVIKYYKEIESGGISVDIYYEYYVNQKACKGIKDDNGKTISGSKKEQILKVIDALPLTSKQKDLLYFQNNWSESTLYQAPWH